LLCQNIVPQSQPPYNGSIQILLGNGNETFQTPVVYSIDGLRPLSIFVADFNNDKRLDLAVLNLGSNNITVLLGNGDGTFGTSVDYAMPSGTQSNAMAIGDLNGDGRADLAVPGMTNSNGTNTVSLTNPDGSFGPGTNWITTTSIVCAQSCAPPTSVAIADVNNDGKLDVIADDNVEFSLVCLIGNGDGTFNPAIPSDLAASSGVFVSGNPQAHFAIADFNADGKQDVAETVIGSHDQGSNLAIYLGNGDGTFQSPLYLEEAGPLFSFQAISIASADLNGDGFADLALAMLGSGAGTDTVSVVLVVPARA
jgi:FG-GAP-like repeat